MRFQSQNPVIGRAFLLSIIAALTTRAAAALIGTPKLRLSTSSSFVPTPTSVISDFTASESDFSNYTAGGYALTFTAPVNGGDGIVGAVADTLIEAAAATPFVSNRIRGYWVDDGTNVLMAEALPASPAFLMAAPGDWLLMTVFLPFALQQLTGLV